MTKTSISPRLWLVAALAFFTLGATAQAALEKTVLTPGTLQQLVGNDLDATQLTVTGKIDVRDLDFVTDNMRSLKTLDLSKAEIQEWEGARSLTSSTTYPANELPKMSLAGCTATTIELPSTITVIGEGALAGTAITKITIPTSVTTIEAGAFAGSALTSIDLSRAITLGTGAFRNCKSLQTASLEGVTEVPDYCFDDCTALRTVKMSHFTRTIGNYAFNGCTSLTEATIASNGWALVSIGSHAFSNTAIEELDFSNQKDLRNIGDWAFANCPQLKSVTFAPHVVWNLGEGAFFDDAELVDYEPASPAQVKAATFKGVEKLDLNTVGGQRADSIGDYAFYGMKNLTRFHLSDNLTYIGSHAFDGCSSLAEMNAPAIAQVPALGDDVWGDIDKSNVTLGVPDNMISEFSSTPVWQEFRIMKAGDTPTSIGPSTAGPAVKARFVGSLLELQATHTMNTVSVIDLDGRTLMTATPKAETATLNTGGWIGQVFIVRVVLEDGRIAVSKLSR